MAHQQRAILTTTFTFAQLPSRLFNATIDALTEYRASLGAEFASGDEELVELCAQLEEARDIIEAARRNARVSPGQYVALCTVINNAKVDDDSRDTDEYAARVLVALGLEFDT